ncbi:hypothetical protein BYT27DRAFT_7114038, partial [Phlegmacium glaucopus]
SYKSTCGAPALKSSLKRSSGTVSTKLVKPKKASRPTHTGGNLVYTIKGPKLPVGAWCSGCRNGGTVVLCTTCETISICTDCIDFKEDEESTLFECPPCFLKKDNKAIYPFSFKAVSSTREHWPKILTTKLVIISIHMEGMDDTPSLLTYYHLHPWLQGNLVHIEMDFNFDDGPHNDFESQLGLMLDAFETGDLQECTQFFVMITTHYDPTSGYLHIGPNNIGSVPVNEVLSFDFFYLL